MGGQTEAVTTLLKTRHQIDMSLTDALRLAVEALASIGGEGGKPRTLDATQLEVAVLDRARKGRKFRRLTGAALTPLLGAKPAVEETPADETPVTKRPTAARSPPTTPSRQPRASRRRPRSRLAAKATPPTERPESSDDEAASSLPADPEAQPRQRASCVATTELVPAIAAQLRFCVRARRFRNIYRLSVSTPMHSVSVRRST